jgi:hypothetical protein
MVGPTSGHKPGAKRASYAPKPGLDVRGAELFRSADGPHAKTGDGWRHGGSPGAAAFVIWVLGATLTGWLVLRVLLPL